jgi:glycosyltransferase domain-containing protein
MLNEKLNKFLKKNFQELKKNNLDLHNFFSDLTIVIPTYNRLPYLIRQIKYLSNYSAKLIIVDGSNEKISEKLINELKFCKDFTYIHSTELSYIERIKFASKKVQTTFAMCLAEDDFLVFTGVNKAINVLKNDNSLSACFGQVAGLDYSKTKKKSFFIDYGLSLKNYSISQTKPLDRLFFAFNSYRSFSPYAVFRKKIFETIWSKIETCSCLELTEYEHAINTLLVGQIKTIDEIFWIRSQELDSLDSKLDGSRKNDYKKWYEDKFFEGEVKKFKKRVSKNIAFHLKYSPNESLKLLDSLIILILDKKSHVGLENKNNFKLIISLIKNLLISNSLTRKFYNNFRNTNFGNRFRLFARRLGNKNINSDLLNENKEELEKILKITDFFHKNF